MAPLVRGRKGQHKEAFEAIRRAGLLRARVDGQVVEIREEPKLAKTRRHDIEAVVDRLVIREGIRPRLAESVELALRLGEGAVVLSVQEGDGWADRLLSTRYSCPSCGAGFAPIEPRTLSFNSPYGACPTCDGLGVLRAFDAELVIPDPAKSLDEGAVVAWEALKPAARAAVRADPSLGAFLKSRRLDRSKPLRSWSKGDREAFLRGEPSVGFAGVIPDLERLLAEARTDAARSAIDAFRSDSDCPACGGRGSARSRGRSRWADGACTICRP